LQQQPDLLTPPEATSPVKEEDDEEVDGEDESTDQKEVAKADRPKVLLVKRKRRAHRRGVPYYHVRRTYRPITTARRQRSTSLETVLEQGKPSSPAPSPPQTKSEKDEEKPVAVEAQVATAVVKRSRAVGRKAAGKAVVPEEMKEEVAGEEPKTKRTRRSVRGKM